MKTLGIGIGCRLHSSASDIEAAVLEALGSLTRTPTLAFEQIHTVGSIASKANEAGLLEFCARHGLPLELFSLEQIAAIKVQGPSAAAREHLGVEGVCEPCALLAAQMPPGSSRLVVRKTIRAGITVAVASSAPAVDPNPIHPNTLENQQDLP